MIAKQQEADNFDPPRSVARAAAEALFLMGDTLTSLDYDLRTVRPGLAERWTTSRDGRVYTFHLRKDVKFHSGRPMTSRDVKYSFDRWIDPKTASPAAWRAGDVEEIKVVDDYTLEYRLKKAYSELLLQLAQSFAIIVDREAVEHLGSKFGVAGFGGTGPYQWVEWAPRDRLVLRRNPNYRWGPPIYQNHGPAFPEQVVFRVIPEDTTRVLELESGAVSASIYVPARELSRVESAKSLTLTRIEPFFWTDYLGFKVTRPLVADVTLRRALSYAVNKPELAKTLMLGHADPAVGYMSPAALDYWKGAEDIQFAYDPAKAMALLEQAGWKLGPDRLREKDGAKLRLVMYALPRYQELLTAVQGMFRKVGADLDIQIFDATVFWGKARTQEFDMWIIDFPYVSAGDALLFYFASKNRPAPNRMNWADPETDRLLEAGSAAADPKARAQAFASVQRRLYEAALWIPLFHERGFMVTSTKVKGLRPHGIYGVGFYKALDAWLEEGR